MKQSVYPGGLLIVSDKLEFYRKDSQDKQQRC